MLIGRNPNENVHWPVRNAISEAQKYKEYYLIQEAICIEITVPLGPVKVSHNYMVS